MRIRVLAALAALAATPACAPEETTGYILKISSPDQVNVTDWPTHLLIKCLVDDTVTVDETYRFSRPGEYGVGRVVEIGIEVAPSLMGKPRLYWVRAINPKNTTKPAAEAAGILASVGKEKQVVPVTLKIPGPLGREDTDGDGIPDFIETCRQRNQPGPCPGSPQDGGATEPDALGSGQSDTDASLAQDAATSNTDPDVTADAGYDAPPL